MNRTIENRNLAATEDHAILLEASSLTAGSPERSFLFRNPVEWLEARDLSELPLFFQRLEAARAQGLWSAGYFSYECGYHWEPTAALNFIPNQVNLPLAAFGLYLAPTLFTADLIPSGLARGVESPSLGISCEDFQEKIRIVHGYIEAGDTYQVNLTDQVRARYSGSALQLFAHMMEAQPVAFGALLRLGDRFILSASPESPLHLSLHSFQSTADGEHKAHFELAGNDDLPQRHLHLIALQNSVHIER